MANTVNQNYELSFHIVPELEVADVQKARELIEGIIVSGKGKVLFSKDPEKVRLSYPIEYKQFAYFGYVQFNLEDKSEIEEIKSQLNRNNNILRSLFVKLNERKDKRDATRRTKDRKPKFKAAESTKKGEEVKEKELDKKLEEILDKV